MFDYNRLYIQLNENNLIWLLLQVSYMEYKSLIVCKKKNEDDVRTMFGVRFFLLLFYAFSPSSSPSPPSPSSSAVASWYC